MSTDIGRCKSELAGYEPAPSLKTADEMVVQTKYYVLFRGYLSRCSWLCEPAGSFLFHLELGAVNSYLWESPGFKEVHGSRSVWLWLQGVGAS